MELYSELKINIDAFCNKLDTHLKKCLFYECSAVVVFLTFLQYFFCIYGICAVQLCELQLLRKTQGVFLFVINVTYR